MLKELGVIGSDILHEKNYGCQKIGEKRASSQEKSVCDWYKIVGLGISFEKFYNIYSANKLLKKSKNSFELIAAGRSNN